MTRVLQPVIGNWYRDVGGALFEVVSIDDELETLEVQYFDGTIEDMDFEDWDADCEQGDIVKASPPDGL